MSTNAGGAHTDREAGGGALANLDTTPAYTIQNPPPGIGTRCLRAALIRADLDKILDNMDDGRTNML